MTKELWINLPVKDVKKSKDFFIRIGFTPEENHETADITLNSNVSRIISWIFSPLQRRMNLNALI